MDTQGTQDLEDGVIRLAPGIYDYYTQWVTFDDSSYIMVEDKGPVYQGIITIAVSEDGQEAEIKDFFVIEITRIHECGDNLGYWREGCPLQYCDYDTPITEELLDDLYTYNKKITDLARKYGFRASIKLPSKELMVVPDKKEYINIIKEILNM